MKIVKQSNGNVVITDNSGNITKRLNPSAYLQWMSDSTIQIHSGGILTLVVDDITATQVEPAAEIPFSGDAYDLMDLLTTDFFFELSGSGSSVYFNHIAGGDETTPATIGLKTTFRAECDFTIDFVRAALTTAQTSGSIFTVDIRVNSVSILSTLITIDNTEKTSKTALVQPVVSSPNVLEDDEITIWVTQVGDGTATGLKVRIIGQQV